MFFKITRETYVYKRLFNYVEKHNILSNHQYGFRRNRSTEDALLNLTDKISKALDEGKYTIGVFLDLSKAFDTVNHEILFSKLQHYGIRGTCLQWFMNDLNGRTQIVKVEQHRSSEMNVTTGVPQRAILGPLLFLLYINDIENCSDIISFVLYADDTNAFYSNSCLKTLSSTIQNELDKVVQWLNANKLSINASAFFKESSLGGGGGKTGKKRENEKYEPSRFGERASLKRDFVKL